MRVTDHCPGCCDGASRARANALRTSAPSGLTPGNPAAGSPKAGNPVPEQPGLGGALRVNPGPGSRVGRRTEPVTRGAPQVVCGEELREVSLPTSRAGGSGYLRPSFASAARARARFCSTMARFGQPEAATSRALSKSSIAPATSPWVARAAPRFT